MKTVLKNLEVCKRKCLSTERGGERSRSLSGNVNQYCRQILSNTAPLLLQPVRDDREHWLFTKTCMASQNNTLNNLQAGSTGEARNRLTPAQIVVQQHIMLLYNKR